MPRGPLVRSDRSPRLLSLAPVLLAAFGLAAACFDSDEKTVEYNAPSATTGAEPPATSSSSGTTSGTSSSGEPDATCRDAIACVFGCAAELQAAMSPEPDLTCFLECQEGLTEGEILDLFYLTECVTNKCIEQGVCDILVPTETDGSSSGDSTTTGGEESTGSSGGTTGTRPNLCLDCILANMQDPEPQGCQAVALECM